MGTELADTAKVDSCNDPAGSSVADSTAGVADGTGVAGVKSSTRELNTEVAEFNVSALPVLIDKMGLVVTSRVFEAGSSSSYELYLSYLSLREQDACS